jgi:UDPglucose--hexose-1-phosphate uridylyltransferase
VPELRRDPIAGRWVIIATDRAKRPSDFVRQPAEVHGAATCPLCEGRECKTPSEVLSYRSHGQPNEPGWTLRVIPNKFPALRVEGDLSRQGDGMYDKMNGIGAHEVVVETPAHELSLGDLSDKHVEDVFWAYRDRIIDLAKDKRLRHIIPFKNHGEAAGASLEHTHSQLIALPVVPKRALEEIEGARKYFDFKERCVWCDIIRQELESGVRVVMENDRMLAVAPYAPRFPFETWVLPKTHASHFECSDIATIQSLGAMVRVLVRKIEKVLERPPYNLMMHTAPVQEGPMPHFHWHVEVIPKLTKVAGFEWGTGFYMNPTPPEEAAAFLRDARV